MDLRSFSNNEYIGPQPEGVTEAEVKEKIGHYSKMSNDQLMIELAKQIAIQRGEGKTENMKQTIEQIKPFLNAEQKTRMEEILSKMGL